MDVMTEAQARKVDQVIDALALLEKVYNTVHDLKSEISTAMMGSVMFGERIEPTTESLPEDKTFDALVDHLYSVALGELATINAWMFGARGALDLGITLEVMYEARSGKKIEAMVDAALGEDEKEDHDCANCEDRDTCGIYLRAQRAAAKASVN